MGCSSKDERNHVGTMHAVGEYLRQKWSKVNSFLSSSVLIGMVLQPYEQQIDANFVLRPISRRFQRNFARQKEALLGANI